MLNTSSLDDRNPEIRSRELCTSYILLYIFCIFSTFEVYWDIAQSIYIYIERERGGGETLGDFLSLRLD